VARIFVIAKRLSAELSLAVYRCVGSMSEEAWTATMDARVVLGFFQLVSCRYERASMIATSNRPFGRLGESLRRRSRRAAMIDRLVHHAEVVSLRGDSYWLKDRDLGRTSTTNNEDQ
jgi:DNA replication protein DnaC